MVVKRPDIFIGVSFPAIRIFSHVCYALLHAPRGAIVAVPIDRGNFNDSCGVILFVKQPFFNRLASMESHPFMPSPMPYNMPSPMPSPRIQHNIPLPASIKSLYHPQKKVNPKPGVYRCATCRLLLFTSHTLIASGVGWASFRSPVSEKNIEIIRDEVLGFIRREIVCPHCRSHLGYLFEDGLEPTRQRYSVMLAALNFVPGK